MSASFCAYLLYKSILIYDTLIIIFCCGIITIYSHIKWTSSIMSSQNICVSSIKEILPSNLVFSSLISSCVSLCLLESWLLFSYNTCYYLSFTFKYSLTITKSSWVFFSSTYETLSSSMTFVNFFEGSSNLLWTIMGKTWFLIYCCKLCTYSSKIKMSLFLTTNYAINSSFFQVEPTQLFECSQFLAF